MGDRHVPILLWPFYAIWRLLTFVVELIGRLLCGVLGIGLMVRRQTGDQIAAPRTYGILETRQRRQVRQLINA